MRRNGFRGWQTEKRLFAAAPLVFVIAVSFFLPGCSSLQTPSESIVRVQTKQNTGRANRLTYSGIRALNKGEIDLAAKRFREAVDADPAYGPAHNNLGLMHYEQGNLYQAVMAFEEARQYMPNDPAVVYNLGLALEAAGRNDEALELYYTATEMDKANPNFLGNLVRLRVRMGEQDDVLHRQLEDLVLIETRPEWRRWADTQLGLTMNLALDRGPETPDLESAANDSKESERTDIQDKIIDLTPVQTVSMEEELGERSLTPPSRQASTAEASTAEASDSLELESSPVEDLSEEAYYRNR